MQTTIPTLGTISWDCRLMRATAAIGLLLAFGFAQPAAAQNVTTPCTTTSLCLDNNYFVTGDYVVGGVGLRGLGDATGFATGTISIPDCVQAQAMSIPCPPPPVPAGADIVAAFLYWGTVEKSQSAFAGQNGFFNGYAITGTILGNPNAPPSWSSGGCSGSSSGTTTMRAYRADVRPFLPLDANGNVQGNGSYQVKLADSGSNGGGTPLTLGATLVIIYRVLSPIMPLNSIVLYDGAVAPSNASSTFSQPIVGFYQAAGSPVAKITHIVGNGKTNKSESVFLNNTVNLPSLYGTLPPFPGIYNGSWDNPTWSVNAAVLANEPSPSETTSVVPAATNSGCVNWGAIIFSTTVQSSDGDGLLDVWKAGQPQGYTDATNGQWVSLPGATPGQKDLFVEVDYFSNLDLSVPAYPAHSHLPKQAAIDRVGNALKSQTPSVHVHFDLGPGIYKGDPYVISYPVSTPQGATIFPGAGGNAISEGLLVCNVSPGTPLCQFPGQVTTGWKGGYLTVRDQAPNPNSIPPVPGLGNFQPGRGLSYHYVLFGHTLGSPRTYWSAAGEAPSLAGSNIATLVSIMVGSNVGTVTLTTPTPLLKPGDVACSDTCDRVSVGGALQAQNAALNGTYKFLTAPSSTSNGTTFTTTFTIQTAGVANGTYDFSSEPQLGLTFGGPTSASGYSDIGGGDSSVMFGEWPADDPLNADGTRNCQPDPSQPLMSFPIYCNDQVGNATAQAGTLLHELGHTFTLTHGGTFYTDVSHLSVPSYGLNCSPSFLSSMNYLFQLRGFPDVLADGSHPIGYSGQVFSPLDETNLSESTGIGLDTQPGGGAAVHFTRWYAPPNALDTQLQNTTGGRFATFHCDGSPILDGAQMVRVDGTTQSSPIDWNNDNDPVPDPNPDSGVKQDVNFNGVIGDTSFQGFNDWANLDLLQIGARASAFAFSGAGGSLKGIGGGGSLKGIGGGGPLGAGGGSLKGIGGGGSLKGIGGGNEQDAETACSTADPPLGLSAVLSGHTVVLKWTTPGGPCQVARYDIWRSTNGGPFVNISKVNRMKGAPATTFTDNTVKNNNTYTYFVTDTDVQGAQSNASATATVFVKF